MPLWIRPVRPGQQKHTREQLTQQNEVPSPSPAHLAALRADTAASGQAGSLPRAQSSEQVGWGGEPVSGHGREVWGSVASG